MCIRLHLHRMACDARPLVRLARSTPSDTDLSAIRVVDPYSQPRPCMHRILRDTRVCPWNGCCTLSTVDLPCRCAEKEAWGREGPAEDLTQCEHFREYHEYEQYRGNDPSSPAEEWIASKAKYLDDWVRDDDKDVHPSFYCESRDFARQRNKFVELAAGLEGMIGAEEEYDRDEVESRVVPGQNRGLEQTWQKVADGQRAMAAVASKRAEAFLGFSGL
ncbi:hypothetical protein QBC47DRAFT_398867 [Echria macrotheca]|uniref:Uncharacterized protein n=1 Tax=Echria macrotheca TaxID=438768 RepID=A0AAJ0BHB7_9PEZI|nr:hypothetical protein QBC47DRAFT_398867 [Echria macrotheca]